MPKKTQPRDHSTQANPFAIEPARPRSPAPHELPTALKRPARNAASGAEAIVTADVVKAGLVAIKSIADAVESYWNYRAERECTKQVRAETRAERDKIAAWRDVTMRQLKDARTKAKSDAEARRTALRILERALKDQQRRIDEDRKWLKAVLASDVPNAESFRKAEAIQRQLESADASYRELLGHMT